MNFVTTPSYRDDGAEVIPGIWIGSLVTGVAAKNKFDCIVNLSGSLYSIQTMTIVVNMLDEHITTENRDQFLGKFKLAAEIMKRFTDQGQNILVHCAAGTNRSACQIGVYMAMQGWKYDDIMTKLRAANQKRKVALLTNQTFRKLIKDCCFVSPQRCDFPLGANREKRTDEIFHDKI